MEFREELVPFVRRFSAEEINRDFSNIERVYIFPAFKESIKLMVNNWSMETNSTGLFRKVKQLILELSFEFGISTPLIAKTKRRQVLGYYKRKNNKIFISERLINRALDSTDDVADLIYTVCHEFSHALSAFDFIISELSHDGEYFYCLMRVMRHVSGKDLNEIFSTRKFINQFNRDMTIDEYSISLGTFTRVKKNHIVELIEDSYIELIDKLKKRSKSEIDVPYVTIKEGEEIKHISNFEFYSQPFQYLKINKKTTDNNIYRYANVIIKKRGARFSAIMIKSNDILENKKNSYISHLEFKLKEVKKLPHLSY